MFVICESGPGSTKNRGQRCKLKLCYQITGEPEKGGILFFDARQFSSSCHCHLSRAFNDGFRKKAQTRSPDGGMSLEPFEEPFPCKVFIPDRGLLPHAFPCTRCHVSFRLCRWSDWSADVSRRAQRPSCRTTKFISVVRNISPGVGVCVCHFFGLNFKYTKLETIFHAIVYTHIHVYIYTHE